MRDAAIDEDLWRGLCLAVWKSPNIGSLVPSYRECVHSANGWLHVAKLPRSIINAEPPLLDNHADSVHRGTRSQQTYTISSFDSDDSVTALSTRLPWPSVVIKSHSDEPNAIIELPLRYGVVRYLHLIPQEQPPTDADLRLIICTDNGVHGGVVGVRRDLSLVPLWDVVHTFYGPVPWPPEESILTGGTPTSAIIHTQPQIRCIGLEHSSPTRALARRG